MTTPTLSLIQNGDCQIQIAHQGTGPLVVFCHGFPGLWTSWRNQIEAVSAAGFTAVALDMRGYGGSSKPQAISDYGLDKIRGDLKAVLAHFNEPSAIFVGTDFGAAVVWNMAVAEPDRVRGLVVLSVPYDHDYYGYFGQGSDSGLPPPSERFAAAAKTGFLHAHYFQQPDVAERELDPQPHEFLTRLFWALSGKGDLMSRMAEGKPGMGYLEVLGPASEPLPWPWMSIEDMENHVQAFSIDGFRGALNWYRVADQNWHANRQYIDKKIEQPCLFIAGQQDPVIQMGGDNALRYMESKVSGLQDIVLIEDAGHLVQMEQAEQVNEKITAFLKAL